MKTILLIDSGYLKNVFKNNDKFYDAELKCHADFVYDVNFPKSSSKIKNFVAKKSA